MTQRVGRLVDPDRPDVVILRGREDTLEIELLQDGQVVPRRDGEYNLQPKPFTLRLRGNPARASYLATTNFSKTEPLEAVDRPLVFFSGSGGIWPSDSLALMHEDEVAIDVADSDFFRRQWIARQGRAEELAGFLQDTLGDTPAVASFRHYYLGLTGRASDSATVEAERSPTRVEETGTDFNIQSIGQKPIGDMPRVRLVVFFQSPLGRTFSQVAWEKFDLHFAEVSEDQ
ncbi:MAG: hypothetical protein ACOC9S_01790 [Planctomycetota bacterium]